MLFLQSKKRVISLVLIAFAAIFMVWVVASGLFVKKLPPPENPRYLDASLTTEERILDLLSHMTLEEKVGQMALVEKNSIRNLRDVTRYGIGGILSGSGAKPEINTLEGWQETVLDFDLASRESRLKIPVLYGIDANHGHSNVPGATVFPHLIGLGATGDPELVRRVARATGEELLATGIYWSYSPTLDLPEDIRWGRVYEAFSDDPELASELGVAYIEGLQEWNDTTTSDIAILATPKHYVGGGAMLWNTSSNENFRIDQGTTPASEAKLRETYLQPFEAAVDAGAMSVMVGLNSWGDTKLSANKYLITDVLKGELGFEGFAVSDWYGVYEISENKYHSAVTAINAGIDMVMLPFEYQIFTRDITRAVRRGDISEERIDDAVRRILRAKFALGLFERAYDEKYTDTFGADEHRALAREAVAKSLVLLKDDANILPIRSYIDHIRVAGSAADNGGKQMGAWTVEWQGVDGNWLPGVTSILSGIRDTAGEHVRIEYDQRGNFNTDELADIGIAVVGESPYAEGWGDNEYPTLSPEDLTTIERLKESSRQVVVVLITGRPLLITDKLEDLDALVVAWLPGSEGQGVADVLFGDESFTGTLPLPWPADITQLPIAPDGTTRDGTPPLFPRSFGLR